MSRAQVSTIMSLCIECAKIQTAILQAATFSSPIYIVWKHTAQGFVIASYPVILRYDSGQVDPCYHGIFCPRQVIRKQ